MTAVDELLATVTGNPVDADPAVVGPVVKHGRYHHTHPVTGKPMRSTRASNFSKLLADAYQIQQWEKRCVLLGSALRPDITARAVAAGADDKATLDSLAAEAKEVAGGSRGANLGTAMHDLTDRLDRGEDVEAPEPLAADLRAYREALDLHGVGIRRDLIEHHVCVPELEVCGRFDRIVEWGGRLVVADLKTQASVAYGFLEIAVQLALYARAEWMWSPGVGWVRKPPVALDEALVFHLPIGAADCRLYAVDIAAGWEAVQHAVGVRDWRRRSKSLGRALDVAGTDDLEALLDASTIATGGEVTPPAGTVEAPAASPPVASPDGRDNPRFIAEAAESHKARLAAALDALGDRLPLGVEWPASVPKYRDGGPTNWVGVRAVERFVLDLERAARRPFADPLPENPLEGLPGAAPEPKPFVRPAPVPPRTPPDVYIALQDRFAAIAPEDLRAAATAEAREAGCADVEHLDIEGIATLRKILTAAEASYEQRKGYVASLLQSWDDPGLVALLVATVAPGHSLEALGADDIERLELVLDALDGGVLVPVIDDAGDWHLTVPPGTEARLALAYAGKAALRDAAQQLAAAYGRPKPRSAAEAVADPVLVAALAAETPTSKEQGAT